MSNRNIISIHCAEQLYRAVLNQLFVRRLKASDIKQQKVKKGEKVSTQQQTLKLSIFFLCFNVCIYI